MDFASVEAKTPETSVESIPMSIVPQLELAEPELLAPIPALKIPKDEIRTSLRASTWDAIFAAIFSNSTGGVILTGFLMKLNATPFQIGLLAAIPMLAGLMQPIGAYWSEQTTSRFRFCLAIHGVSRLLWSILAVGILFFSWQSGSQQLLIPLTLGIALIGYILAAMGCPPWLSWMAVLVPRRLRGRYFGFRNSAANLTSLISIPLMGLIVSKGFGDSLIGYSVVILIGIVAGMISLGCQYFKTDVNPQMQRASVTANNPHLDSTSLVQFLLHPKLLIFFLYVGCWAFAVNLSAPFFNLYMLDNLALDISQVTLYNGLTSAANLLMLIGWGKLADRIGNRPILLAVGILVAVTPLFWLVIGANPISLWLWLPVLHLLMGGTNAAIDLCGNNLQIGISPLHHQATFFGVVAAVAGTSSALGTVTGGLLAQNWSYGGLLGLFALSSIFRLIALLPLVFVHEQHVA